MFTKHFQRFFLRFLGISLLQSTVKIQSTPVPDELNSNTIGGEIIACDPLGAQGTSILCFPPSSVPNEQFGPSNDCSQPSTPSTVASYSCRNHRGEVYMGFLTCSRSGIWITSLEHANNSICNLEASILNFETPDVVVVSELPEFTTPSPNRDLMQPDVSSLSGYEALTLQLHNTFRRNHGVPMVEMSEKLNMVAQQYANSVISGGDLTETEANFKFNPVHSTMNVEMNWYFQVPTSPNDEEAVSNAVQSWYSGFTKYDWENAERNLEVGDALAFARVIWKATKLIGVGVATSEKLTFVACVYTPGRNVTSTDPTLELQLNVPTFRIG